MRFPPPPLPAAISPRCAPGDLTRRPAAAPPQEIGPEAAAVPADQGAGHQHLEAGDWRVRVTCSCGWSASRCVVLPARVRAGESPRPRHGARA